MNTTRNASVPSCREQIVIEFGGCVLHGRNRPIAPALGRSSDTLAEGFRTSRADSNLRLVEARTTSACGINAVLARSVKDWCYTLTPSPFTQFSEGLEPMLALGEARTEATHGL